MINCHDDPTPYQGVAEMVARNRATLLVPWEIKQVSDEHHGERACRADGPVTHDPAAVAEMGRYFDSLGPEWQELFAEIDRRDPNMRKPGDNGPLLGTEIWARRFAEERHGSQRYGEHPYVVHLWAVRQVLTDFGYHGGPLAVAAWLHDLIEDTPTTRQEIAERFGEEVAMPVWAVTGIGKNRKERNVSAYEKIRQCPKAATLKLADRIANVEASQACPDKLAMYRKEREEFVDAIGHLGESRMWERLARALETTDEQGARHRRESDAAWRDIVRMAAEDTRPPGEALIEDLGRLNAYAAAHGFSVDDDEPSAGDVAEAVEMAK